MKKILFLIATIMCFGLAQADSYVDSLGADVVSRLPRGWVAKKGEWKYFDVKNCFQGTKSCAGNNPSSPYGYPFFADEQISGTTLAYQIDINEALVLIFRTPPDSRYYAFTPYFMKAHNSAEIDFASLSDSLNHRKLVTTGSVLPGGAPFNQYSVIVWTANIIVFPIDIQTLNIKPILQLLHIEYQEVEKMTGLFRFFPSET